MSGERIKRAVKAILPRLLDGIGIYDRALASAEQTGAAWLVVMYHRVIRSTDSDPFRLGMCVTEQRFKEQVAFFADQFEPITVLEGVSRLRAGKRFPRRAVSITFDDGYRDNAEIAWPILRQRAMPMSLYVPSGIFQSHPHHWWDRVIHAVYTTSNREITLASVGLGGQDAVLNLSERQRGNAVRRILEMLWSQPIAGALASVAAIEACLQPPRQGATLPQTVSIEQLKKLSQEGVEIGAHSVTHPNMRLLSDDEIAREVSESKQALEQLLGTPVAGFAYPSGFYDDRVVQAVRASQFQYAVSTEPGLNARLADPYLIERMGAPETNLADLKRCIANLARQD